MEEGAQEPWGLPFVRTVMPIMRVEPNHLPKTPPAHTIIVGFGFQHMDTRWGHKLSDQSDEVVILPVSVES